MKVGIASDHRGYKVKQKLIKYLNDKDYDVADYGCDSEELVDYPDYGIKLGEAIRDKDVETILSGEKSFNFTIDLNDLIHNYLGEGPFSEKNNKYPIFDKGDLYFFEIDFFEGFSKEKNSNEQINMYPFRGEIKK